MAESKNNRRNKRDKRTSKPRTSSKSNYHNKDEKSNEDIYKSQQLRLNKYIAQTGLCSRREADKYITSGLIEVNNKIVKELGTKVTLKDTIKYNGKALYYEKFVYILLNKPKDYVTTTKDPHAKKKVIDLVKNACNERIYPVGRLDRNTTGLLLFTNDGELTSKLTHPKFKKKKIYHVWLDHGFKETHMQQFIEGVELEDGLSAVDAIKFVDFDNKKQVGVEIHSGKNRIIRRMFEHFGYDVVKLDRVYYAGLTKKNLGRGRWRLLNDKEIAMLKMGAFE